jgi:hypothetical protein
MRLRRRIYWAVRQRDGGLRYQAGRFTPEPGLGPGPGPVPGAKPQEGYLTRALKGRDRVRFRYYYDGTSINLSGPYTEYWVNGKRKGLFTLCTQTQVIHRMGPRRILLNPSGDIAGAWYLNRGACLKAVSRAKRVRADRPFLLCPAHC